MDFYHKYIKYKLKYINLKNKITQLGGKNKISKIIYEPIYIKEFYIYDIFYNDRNQIIIICPSESSPLNIFYQENNNISDTNSNTNSDTNKYIKKFNLEKCPHKHTFIYICNVDKYKKKINLVVNGKKIETNVNKYPEFPNEIIMSTLVRNEDNYILQWIKYNLKLGIQRFIIYDNKNNEYQLPTKIQPLNEKSNLKEVLKEYIEDGIVVLIDWPYTYRLPISGISGQTTQQNHSIWAFNRCKYIGLFDIDEYLNPQTEEINIDKILSNIIKKKNINIKELGSFVIKCKLFFNPKNLPTDGFNFLKIYNSDTITLQGREKNFVIPSNVKTFSVHMITKGKKEFYIDNKILYFNHYFFLNKKERGKYKTKYIDKTIKRIVDVL